MEFWQQSISSYACEYVKVTPKEAARRLEREFDDSRNWLSEGQIKVRQLHPPHLCNESNSTSSPLQGFFSRYMKKRALGGTGSMVTVEDAEEDDLEVEEEEAIEEQLEEQQFVDNVEMATEVI